MRYIGESIPKLKTRQNRYVFEKLCDCLDSLDTFVINTTGFLMKKNIVRKLACLNF